MGLGYWLTLLPVCYSYSAGQALVAGLDHLSSPIEVSMFTPFFLLVPSSSSPPTNLYLITLWISPVKLTVALWKISNPSYLPVSAPPPHPHPRQCYHVRQHSGAPTLPMKPKYRRTFLGDRQPGHLSLMLVGPWEVLKGSTEFTLHWGFTQKAGRVVVNTPNFLVTVHRNLSFPI